MCANLDLVRSIMAAAERGDFFSGTEWYHPEYEWVMCDGPTPGSWRGAIAAGNAYREFLAAWEGFRIETDEYRVLDDERVLVLGRRFGRGRTSGVSLGAMGAKGATLFCLRDGKVIKSVFYFDRDRALADLGLEG